MQNCNYQTTLKTNSKELQSITNRRLLDSYVSVLCVLIPAFLVTAARMHAFQGNESKGGEKKSSSNKFHGK